jgi:ABC-2 type transport system permease protein
VYSLDFISPKHRWLFKLNPMLYVLNGFRLSIYYGLLPTPQSAAVSLLCGIAALSIGFGIFRRYQDAFVFYI